MSIEVSNEVRVKNESICYSQSISMKVKEEPKDMYEEVEEEAEEKFSETEEFTNKISIAFLNEEPTQSTTSSDENNVKISKCQRNKEKSK